MYVLLVANPPPLFLNFLKDFYVEGAELFFILTKDRNGLEPSKQDLSQGYKSIACPGGLLGFEEVSKGGFEIIFLINSHQSSLSYTLIYYPFENNGWQSNCSFLPVLSFYEYKSYLLSVPPPPHFFPQCFSCLTVWWCFEPFNMWQ